MIEKTILDYLTTKLSTPVYVERPEDEPATYCLIEKTGAEITNGIETDTIAVQSLGTSLLDAITLSGQAVAAMLAAPAHIDVFKVSLNSEYNFTDTTTKKHRYQAVFSVVHNERS